MNVIYLKKSDSWFHTFPGKEIKFIEGYFTFAQCLGIYRVLRIISTGTYDG